MAYSITASLSSAGTRSLRLRTPCAPSETSMASPSSSISAPWLQAVVLEQAGLRPGLRVLEIGSGGYHAALLAVLVGARCREVIPEMSFRFASSGKGDLRSWVRNPASRWMTAVRV